MCHVSHVTCQMSFFTCPLSLITCHLSNVTFHLSLTPITLGVSSDRGKSGVSTIFVKPETKSGVSTIFLNQDLGLNCVLYRSSYSRFKVKTMLSVITVPTQDQCLHQIYLYFLVQALYVKNTETFCHKNKKKIKDKSGRFFKEENMSLWKRPTYFSILIRLGISCRRL